MRNVEDLIEKSLQELKKIGFESENANENQESKLIFPKYCVGNHAGDKRISEQEARFLFVRELELEKERDFYYSIETPTQNAYRFSENGNKNNPEIDNANGQSGQIDVCVYDSNFNRKHLIEFKSLNPDSHEFEKDFIKLKYEAKGLQTEPNYFVHILKSYDKGTIESLTTKYEAAFDIQVAEKTNVNKVIVCLCILEYRQKYQKKETNSHILWFDETNYKDKLNELI